jgi:carbonic anhydrase
MQGAWFRTILWCAIVLKMWATRILRLWGAFTTMTLLEDILAHNDHFVAERDRPITKSPAKRIALFTCMDTRLVEFLEPAMGLRRGDAKVIKNAGNTIIDPQGGVMRSLVVATFALGCEEIYVIGHRDCGMTQIEEDQFQQRMVDRGVPIEAIAALQPGLKEWLGAFHDPNGNVLRVVDVIRQSPLIPRDVPVHGMMFDPHSGRLELLSDGYCAR